MAAWLLHRDDERSRRAALEAMLPEVVGKRSTVDWPRRVRCRDEQPAVCAPEKSGESGASGDAFYLKEMIDHQPPSPGLIGLLELFLEDGFKGVIVCPPAVSAGIAQCTVGTVGPVDGRACRKCCVRQITRWTAPSSTFAERRGFGGRSRRRARSHINAGSRRPDSNRGPLHYE
jgi:hypothetical protein